MQDPSDPPPAPPPPPFSSFKDRITILLIFFASSLLFLTTTSSFHPQPPSSSTTSQPDPFLFPTRQFHRVVYHDNNSSDPTPPSLAYLLSGSKGDLGRILRLLHSTYHPRNQYLLHLDRLASPSELQELALKLRSNPIFRAAQNVHIIGKS